MNFVNLLMCEKKIGKISWWEKKPWCDEWTFKIQFSWDVNDSNWFHTHIGNWKISSRHHSHSIEFPLEKSLKIFSILYKKHIGSGEHKFIHERFISVENYTNRNHVRNAHRVCSALCAGEGEAYFFLHKLYVECLRFTHNLIAAKVYLNLCVCQDNKFKTNILAEFLMRYSLDVKFSLYKNWILNSDYGLSVFPFAARIRRTSLESSTDNFSVQI